MYFEYLPFKPTRAKVTWCFNELLVCMNSSSFNDLAKIHEILISAIFWDLSKTKEDKEYCENIQKKLLEAKEFLNIEYPIPIKDIDLTIEKIKKLKKNGRNLIMELFTNTLIKKRN